MINQILKILNQAMAEHHSGSLKEAEDLFLKVLDLDPKHPQALHLLGIIAHQKGRNDDAMELVSKSIQSRPQEPYFYNNQGLILYELGRNNDAIKSYQKAIELKPDYPEPYNNLGNLLRETGEIENAIDSLLNSIHIKPDFAEAHYNLGKAFDGLGDHEKAVKYYENAIRYRPGYFQAYNNLGNALRETGNMEAALTNYRYAIDFKPDHVGAHNNMGNLLRFMGRFGEAIDTFNKAIAINPDIAETYCNLGKVFKDLCRLENAADCYIQAIKLNPFFAEAHFNYSIILLLNGNYDEGWKRFEWRTQMAGFEHHGHYRRRTPIWDGSSLNGKRVYIRDEQGLGDTIQFVRFLHSIKEAGGTAVFETRKPLVSLLSKFPGIDEIIDRSEPGKDDILGACDYFIPLMSLAHRFKITHHEFHLKIPYLKAEPDKKRMWKSSVAGEGFKIGIVWAGSSRHLNDKNRSCGLSDFFPLFEIPHLSWIDLQTGKASGQSMDIRTPRNWISLGRRFHDFSDTAGVIENLDLVVSVDTATAHLAGAMGKPTWTILPYSPDWRWMMNRPDSPWYPSMRLFRQREMGDWGGVFKEVAEELNVLTSVSNSIIIQSVEEKTIGSKEYHAKGEKAYQNGDLNLARACFEDAIKIRTDHFQAYFSLGRVHHDQKSYNRALACYQSALKIKPELFEAYFNMGIVYQEIQDYEKAAKSYKRAININPDFVQAYYNLASTYQEQEEYDMAASFYEEATKRKPDYPEAHYNFGCILFRLKKYKDAVKMFQKAIYLKIETAEAYNNLGMAFHGLGNLDEAAIAYQSALKIKPDYVDVYHNMGNLFIDRGDLDQTIRWYKKALIFTPNDTKAFNHIGKLLQSQSYTGEAIEYYERSVQLKPDYIDAHLNLAMANLQNGNLETGWKEYEWRFNPVFYHKIYPYQMTLPRWDGSGFHGKKLLVHSEQGLGDTIHFSRYLHMVKERGGQVIFETVKPLLGLLKNIAGIDMLLEMPCPEEIKKDMDFYIPLMSLPGLFKTEKENIPAKIPYIFSDELKTVDWKKRIESDEFKVGIVWTGNPMNVDHHKRSCGLLNFKSLLDIPHVKLFSLQKGIQEVTLEKRLESMGIINLADRVEDFTDTAAVIENLDLVISVDTAVPHLAGAMGKPVWTLLYFVPDWRWFLRKEYTPWYPTMKLYRQGQPGDWDTVFERVYSDLSALVKK